MAEENKMNFPMYCKLISERIAAAGDRNDKEEAMRLLTLLKEECEVQIKKLEN